jgi:DNA-binding transcriptional regulator of glucitol operon
VRQVILSPRWILWHLLTLGAVITCGSLAAWQWQRAGSAMGSALNIGYGLQWPLFAVFFAVMWWRFLRAEIADVAEARQQERITEPEPAPPAAPASPSPFGPRPAGARPTAVDDDPELAAYNRMLAQLNARPPEE